MKLWNKIKSYFKKDKVVYKRVTSLEEFKSLMPPKSEAELAEERRIPTNAEMIRTEAQILWEMVDRFENADGTEINMKAPMIYHALSELRRYMRQFEEQYDLS